MRWDDIRCKRMTFVLFLFQKKRVRKRRSKPAKHVLEALQGTSWHTAWINNFFIFFFLFLCCFTASLFLFSPLPLWRSIFWKWRNLFEKPSNDYVNAWLSSPTQMYLCGEVLLEMEESFRESIKWLSQCLSTFINNLFVHSGWYLIRLSAHCVWQWWTFSVVVVFRDVCFPWATSSMPFDSYVSMNWLTFHLDSNW